MATQPQQESRIALVSVAQTDWDAQGRVTGGADLPLSAAGMAQAELMAEQLAGLELVVLCTGAAQSAQETAAVLAKRLDVPVKTVKGLEELDVGLWEGLTTDQIRQRFPKVYKQWTEQPASVCPPQGEQLESATKRLMTAVERICVKYKSQPVGLVLGRLSMAVVRCQLEQVDLSELWSKVDSDPAWHCLELPPGLK